MFQHFDDIQYWDGFCLCSLLKKLLVPYIEVGGNVWSLVVD